MHAPHMQHAANIFHCVITQHHLRDHVRDHCMIMHILIPPFCIIRCWEFFLKKLQQCHSSWSACNDTNQSSPFLRPRKFTSAQTIFSFVSLTCAMTAHRTVTSCRCFDESWMTDGASDVTGSKTLTCSAALALYTCAASND